MDLNKLEKLNELYRQGALTEEEFRKEKERLTNEADTGNADLLLGLAPENYAALMNFVLILSSFGWIISIVLWVMGKDKSPIVKTQGKYILNWIITWTLLLGVLFIFFIGILARYPILAILPFFIWGILGFLFPIIGGIQCLNRGVWRYPLTIMFIK